MSCTKTAEPIKMQFLTLNRQDIYCIGCRCRLGNGHFSGCPADWEAL